MKRSFSETCGYCDTVKVNASSIKTSTENHATHIVSNAEEFLDDTVQNLQKTREEVRLFVETRFKVLITISCSSLFLGG